MKKIYLALLAVAMGVSAQAQRNLRIDVAIAYPSVDSNILSTATGPTINALYGFQNNSATDADSIQLGDTVVFFTPTSPFSGPSYTGYSYFVAPRTLKKGDIIAVNNTGIKYSDIEGLYDATKTLIAKPFTSNKQYYWYLRVAGVAPKTGGLPIATFTAGAADTQRIWINKGTAINENTLSGANIITYPNPAVNQLSFECADLTGDVKASILDLTGRLIATQELVAASNNKYSFDVTSLASGTYILKLDVGEKMIARQFQVKK